MPQAIEVKIKPSNSACRTCKATLRPGALAESLRLITEKTVSTLARPAHITSDENRGTSGSGWLLPGCRVGHWWESHSAPPAWCECTGAATPHGARTTGHSIPYTLSLTPCAPGPDWIHSADFTAERRAARAAAPRRDAPLGTSARPPRSATLGAGRCWSPAGAPAKSPSRTWS
jgi:hypothetical protein